MLKNLIEKMTWPRAALLAVMTAVVIALSIVDLELYLRPEPVAFIGQVEIPAEPRFVSDEPTILLDVPEYGSDDDGILDPEMVIGIPAAEYFQDSDSDLPGSLGSVADLLHP